MKYQMTALAALMVLGSSSFAIAQTPAPAMSGDAMHGDAMHGDAMMMKGAGTTLKLAAQNGSGETGTATLTQVGDDVKVVVSMTGGNAAGPQPIHIHDGTCAKLDPKPKYPLTTVQDGKSTTTVKGVKLADLMNGDYAINVHKSTTEIATYVACGDIPKK
jgi:hypothetical protein